MLASPAVAAGAVVRLPNSNVKAGVMSLRQARPRGQVLAFPPCFRYVRASMRPREEPGSEPATQPPEFEEETQ